jgi:Tfp pilus assembly protein PilZ
MRILKARYRGAADFLAAYQVSLAGGGLYFPTREHVTVGEPVVVEVRFPELGDRLLLRGTVTWRRGARVREGTPAGVGVEFDAAEAIKRDFLLGVARGEAATHVVQRNHRRLPISLPVRWHIKDERDERAAVISDIGPGGAFLVTTQPCATGTQVILELLPPGGAAPLSIEARVAWSRHEPGAEGFGVEFRCRDTGGLRRLKEMVRRLEKLDASAA